MISPSCFGLYSTYFHTCLLTPSAQTNSKRQSALRFPFCRQPSVLTFAYRLGLDTRRMNVNVLIYCTRNTVFLYTRKFAPPPIGFKRTRAFTCKNASLVSQSARCITTLLYLNTEYKQLSKRFCYSWNDYILLAAC